MLDLCGGPNSAVVVVGRGIDEGEDNGCGCGCCGCEAARGGGLSSTDGEVRFGGSGAPKKCRASTEPPSSMGVNMLWDLAAECLRSGGDDG